MEFSIKFINPISYYIQWQGLDKIRFLYWFLFFFYDDFCGCWKDYAFRILGVQFQLRIWYRNYNKKWSKL